ncbi:sensor histidine kinase [Paenibacillus sp. D51F]
MIPLFARLNLFLKILSMLVAIIAITMLFYGRSHRQDIDVITGQLTATDLNHLEYFTQQLDSSIDQLSTNAHMLQRDPTLRDYGQISGLGHLVDQNRTIAGVLEKLSLLSSSGNLNSRIMLYNVQTRESLSPDSSFQFDESLLERPLSSGWEYIPPDSGSGTEGEFRMILASPSHASEAPMDADLIMEVRFPAANVQKSIQDYQVRYTGDTFLYRPGTGLVHQQSADLKLVDELLGKAGSMEPGRNKSAIVEAGGKRYLTSIVWSPSLGWHVVHYSALEQILKPLESSRRSFYTASFMLLALGVMFSFLLFRQVQRPVSMLIKAVHRLKERQWSTRIHLKSSTEFSLLNEEFNEMADQIQKLIERVYAEELRVKDAYLKQLQSQINPHFLYNCLYFMKSKARIGDTDSVEAMALNLAEYFRYITRLDAPSTTIREELALLDNYLSIQNLRKQRLDYRIDVPEALLDEPIARLLLQPLVENSIVHGIEKKPGIGCIHIHGGIDGNMLHLAVEDSGPGLQADEAERLSGMISNPVRQEGSCGLWNVQQRLRTQYGPGSGLAMEPSRLGGLKITLCIQRKEDMHAAAASG